MTEPVLCRDYVAGTFLSVSAEAADAEIVRASPADFEDCVSRVLVCFDHVQRAIAAARAAFVDFADLEYDARAEQLLSLRRAIEQSTEGFVDLLVREIGKPRWEARTEVTSALNKIDITLADGRALIEGREMGSPKQRYGFRPHGVGAVLGPFNFPLHLVHGHVVPALLAGNTLVIKPSELAPGVAQLYAECLAQAGFAPGVVNVVHGGGEVGALLAAHDAVDLVMFTGSYAVGQAIRRATIDQAHKLLVLEMGGRNPALVLADANLEKAVHDVVWGATISAGQRCSGTAVALVERSLADAFIERAQKTMEALTLGHPSSDGTFMGPLVSAAARERFRGALRMARAGGARALTADHEHPLESRGAYICPTLHYVERPASTPYETEELFGPDLAVEVVDDLEHAVARANASEYGLSCSVFTADRARFLWALRRLRYGAVNLNAPTCGASSRLPFGGLRRSGNHRPAALFSTLYATYPVATLEGSDKVDRATLSPGFNIPE